MQNHCAWQRYAETHNLKTSYSSFFGTRNISNMKIYKELKDLYPEVGVIELFVMLDLDTMDLAEQLLSWGEHAKVFKLIHPIMDEIVNPKSGETDIDITDKQIDIAIEKMEALIEKLEEESDQNYIPSDSDSD